MFWLITPLMLAAQTPEPQKIYVAPPTIHDERLEEYQPYLTSLLVSSANTNKHWVKRSHGADQVFIYDKNTIGYALDTTCNYSLPLVCAQENYHWALVTDIFTTEQFATIVVKLYNSEAQLLASSSKSSYAIEKCQPQVKETTIKQTDLRGQNTTEITEKLPDKCIILKPGIVDKDIKQAITILFASIPPL